jgi:hypothetical protein
MVWHDWLEEAVAFSVADARGEFTGESRGGAGVKIEGCKPRHSCDLLRSEYCVWLLATDKPSRRY